MDFRLDIGGYGITSKGCRKTTDKKLSVHDWMSDLPETEQETDFVEVQFKNTRKGYFLNSTKIPLEKGDMVAVEASPGHDIGEVTLTGRLVLLQMKRNNLDPSKMEIRRVYRKAKESDLEKYREAKAREQETMIKARRIAEEMKLDMKIGDVEYQGDGNKAIFYYIANERVDFRQLIKVFAETFRVRIEMKQIGARQEAGRIGGIGPCGRELCCSKWMKNFCSVSTSAARYQDISLNPQKLAGQCAKLKCCMNFEVDAYVEALKKMPSKEIRLETQEGTYYHFKTDVFKELISYSTDPKFGANVVTIPAWRAKEIIAMNKQGEKPDTLLVPGSGKSEAKEVDYENVVGQDSLTRFDKKKGGKGRSKKRGGKGNGNNNNKPQANNAQAAPGNKANSNANAAGKPKGQGSRPRQNAPKKPKTNADKQQPDAPKKEN